MPYTKISIWSITLSTKIIGYARDLSLAHINAY
jgi:hypothetical protein